MISHQRHRIQKMGRYAGAAQITSAASKPALVFGSDGAVHAEVVLITCGYSSSPADNQFKLGLYENSDMGTGGSAVTPKKIGYAATSSVTLKKGTFSGDPTITGINMIPLPVYMRSVNSKVRALGEGWKAEAVAANRGVGVWTDVSGGGLNLEVGLEWFE
jgi:hypothetical protein